MPAFFRGNVDTFLASSSQNILGQLTSATAGAGFHNQTKDAIQSWEQEIDILQQALATIRQNTDTTGWGILLEYPIPRRSKRIDVVLIANGIVLVLEFKCGATTYARDAINQVDDYCQDLRDFHLESRNRTIVPILVATHAGVASNTVEHTTDQIPTALLANSTNLGSIICAAVRAWGEVTSIDYCTWDHSAYLPTPTMIESAQHLYAGQNVQEISRSHSGAENLTRTTQAVIDAIQEAQTTGEKIICFITGVPGAGKTLAGLNIVHNHKLHEGDLGVFLSGNGPLVKVLSAALARDEAERKKTSLGEARRQVSTFIQNVHGFLDAHFIDKARVPPDRVIVFDEAQRAWDAKQAYRKFKRPYSEPQMIMSIMDRHPGWAVVVALIGGGQEINSGEAGLAEWGRNIFKSFPNWRVLISPELKTTHFAGHEPLFEETPIGIDVREDPSLHLGVSLRSYRAEGLSRWVTAVLDYCPAEARRIFESDLDKYAIFTTRSLDAARSWLRNNMRGTRRGGLLASSGARRLRPVGLDVAAKIEVEHWFLNPINDVRSSYSLEQPATEFDIQGLELDWTGLAWGGDLMPTAKGWQHRQFRGTRWTNVNNVTRQRFILNKYRVLLTRAREGMIIYIPMGCVADKTRLIEPYNDLARYLQACGVKALQSD